MTYFGFTRSSASSTIFKSFTPGLQLNSIYSPPPPPQIPQISGLTKKWRYSEIGGIGSHYIRLKNFIWDLEIGRGIRGEAVLGGAVMGGGGGGDCSNLRLYLSGEIKKLTIQPFVKKSVVPLIQYNF